MNILESNEFFNPKCINLPYTIGIIKPDTCLKNENVITNLVKSKKFIYRSKKSLIKSKNLVLTLKI